MNFWGASRKREPTSGCYKREWNSDRRQSQPVCVRGSHFNTTNGLEFFERLLTDALHMIEIGERAEGVLRSRSEDVLSGYWANPR